MRKAVRPLKREMRQSRRPVSDSPSDAHKHTARADERGKTKCAIERSEERELQTVAERKWGGGRIIKAAERQQQ
ncbi:hypothetical protein NDU88_000970 [Pleurodeles waltl]|uniref:Uncharacterized protein n=1 Tax=Pleurodeles waltl TaxID=8319 RepID=A0AAV7WL46_PLEWA|nr:hypothetical protein NDU88_000970 [Pleurodeles waltl]